ncbi:hypothetical protein RchiOBHm_Chr7g0207781 [Rosa chinensis]|uniref:Uncharacterized protein n=1 Tax=Rosa chinensis TaxID=74649 RepID=A0A2P6P9J5_ROSCH|nr:hypothetical protein RchiOBHm_Chr7g0207781 [Rosa chinensis]
MAVEKAAGLNRILVWKRRVDLGVCTWIWTNDRKLGTNPNVDEHSISSVQVSSMWSGSVQGRHMARLGVFLFGFIKRKGLVPYRILK